MLRALFKGVLVFTLLALLILLIFGLTLWIGWPWWVGFFLLVGVAGAALAAVLVRKMLLRRKEQMFVQDVIAQDESNRQRMAPKEQDTARELQARWKEAIDALRKSHLRKQGNPLYILPWYMVIGESGSGKTTAIQSARLTSPFAEVSRTSGISGTRNCDWWFFEQAIILDTAGRYALPVDQERDKDEWQKFLTLLARFRKKEPLNGLVVTIAADRLAQASAETLREDGRTLRKRIEELTRVLGARSPIYVLVTKCDLIQGATHFCEQLPEPSLNQAMGYVNQNLSADAGAVIAKAVATVGDRLRELRLLLLHRLQNRSAAAAMLLFPEELEKLKDGLAAFAQTIFQENPYQETPLLRGIFFSSGRQEGTPFSHFLSALGLIQARDVLKGTSKGLFLHDFFARILPTDRNLFRPTSHMQEWRRLTRNLGLTAWVAVVVAVCGLLSYSFVKNLNALSDVRREFDKPALLQGELMADVMAMDRFREAVLQVERGNRNWWIPRLGLNESLAMETALKQKYVNLFRNGFLQSFDKGMADRMTTFDATTPGPVFGAHVAHLVRRINLLKARLSREDLGQLAGLPQPAYTTALVGRGEVIPEMQEKIGSEYLYALLWERDNDRLSTELTHLQTWLKHLMTRPGLMLNWLVDWVNSEPDLAAVTLQEFWGGDPRIEAATVPPAFTQAGKARIDAAIAEIEAALFDPLIVAAPKAEFAAWYQKNFVTAWQGFGLSFDQGLKLLPQKEQWQAVAKRIPGDSGPYQGLIRRITEEFDAFDPDAGVPAWVGLAMDWQAVRKEALEGKIIDPQKAGLVQKATRAVTANIKKAEKAFGAKIRTPMGAQAQINAAKAMSAYQQALEAAAKAADSRKVAFDLATALFQQDPATGEAPFYAGQRALEELNTIMSDRRDENEKIFWDLAAGNLRFLQKYTIRETACELQSLWERQVLVELQDVSADRDMAQLMMGSDGFATRFLKGPAEPFVARGLAKGYYAKRAMEMEMPFEPAFLTYLSKGAQAARPAKSSYLVKIQAYPTDTNREAKIQPHATVLELQCADSKVRLENLNYPVAKDFNWSPDNCGDVLFQISVGNLVLSKSYTGRNAFAQFLSDFKSGQRTFRRQEFPNDEPALRRMGIDFIKVKYQFQGNNEVLALIQNSPGAPPRKITPCWE